MNRKVFLECVQDKFKWLSKAGFTFKSIDMSVYFVKSKEEEDCCINFFWAEYNEIKIQGLFAFKRFNVVEKLIEKGTGKLNYTISIPLKYNNLNLPILSPNGEIYLSSEDDISKFSELVQKLFQSSALPFFKDFSSLRDVGNWLNKNNASEHSKFLVVSNNSMMLRKLIILKEINSESFSDLYWRYKNYLIAKNATQEKVYMEIYTDFLNFIDYFEDQPA